MQKIQYSSATYTHDTMTHTTAVQQHSYEYCPNTKHKQPVRESNYWNHDHAVSFCRRQFSRAERGRDSNFNPQTQSDQSEAKRQ